METEPIFLISVASEILTILNGFYMDYKPVTPLHLCLFLVKVVCLGVNNKLFVWKLY